jgi:hypothetical protein
MRKEDEERIAAKLAKVMAMTCVRNTKLEDIHVAVVAVTKTGDYSDVVVLNADGRKIPWPEASHIDCVDSPHISRPHLIRGICKGAVAPRHGIIGKILSGGKLGNCHN